MDTIPMTSAKTYCTFLYDGKLNHGDLIEINRNNHVTLAKDRIDGCCVFVNPNNASILLQGDILVKCDPTKTFLGRQRIKCVNNAIVCDNNATTSAIILSIDKGVAHIILV